MSEKCNSIEISALAAAQGGEPIFIASNGKCGDERLVIWALPKSGERIAQTNGDPIGESSDGYAELEAECLPPRG